MCEILAVKQDMTISTYWQSTARQTMASGNEIPLCRVNCATNPNRALTVHDQRIDFEDVRVIHT